MVLQIVAPRPVQTSALISLDLLRNRIPLEFQSQFVEDSRTCLDCGAKVVLKDDELACSKCGRVWSEEVDIEPERIPFADSDVDRGHSEGHFNPGSTLAFGNGLGSVLDGRGLFRILAQGKNGPTDLPLRAMQIRLITKRYEHPTVENLLNYGSKLMKDYGLRSNSESNVLFANVLGKKLRKIAAYFVIRGEGGAEVKRVGACVFYMLYVEKYPGEAEKLLLELNLSSELIQYVQTLQSVLECPKKPKVQKTPKSQA